MREYFLRDLERTGELPPRLRDHDLASPGRRKAVAKSVSTADFAADLRQIPGLGVAPHYRNLRSQLLPWSRFSRPKQQPDRPILVTRPARPKIEMGERTVTALLTDPVSAEALSTLFVIDDDQDIRRAICRLAQAEGLAVEDYASAPNFLEHYDPHKPGCIVLDIRMPGMSGLELQTALSAHGSCPPIIFVSAHGEIPLAMQAMRDGAVDFIPKPFSASTLLQRIHEAMALDQDNRRKRALAAEVQLRWNKLTDREREISLLLATGETTKHIALHLSISPKTVDNHQTRILTKMNVENSTQLANLLATLE
jgi:two-component system, LuxR family, response regulator FixJ